MKLGIVVPGGVARLPEDGRIPCLTWLIERLARRHDVHVFSLHWFSERLARRHARMRPMQGAPPPDRYDFFGATVHEGGAGYAGLRTLAAIVAEHRRGPFDLLQAFWVVPPAVLAVCAGTLLRLPVLAHVTGGELVALPDIEYGGRLTWRGRFWVQLGLSGATRITAASAPIIDALRALGHTADQVSLGVDLTRWPLAAPRARQAGRPARLVHVAGLNRVKDQTTLLHAARRLADQGVDFRLDIAGVDTLDGAIQALVHQLHLGAMVHFHGHLSHAQLYPLVQEADLLLMSSRHEAGQLVVLEAAVAGVPTVGTAVGYVAEWAPDAAVAVPVRDADALANGTLRALQDDEWRLALAREAQRRALAHDADWTAKRFEALYEEVVTAAKGRGHA